MEFGIIALKKSLDSYSGIMQFIKCLKNKCDLANRLMQLIYAFSHIFRQMQLTLCCRSEKYSKWLIDSYWGSLENQKFK